MPNNPFQKATKRQSKLRMALYGASGSGKTYSALSIAKPFGRIALIDTERGSASKYADEFQFDVLELGEYHPQRYIEALRAAAAAGEYDVVIIDSLSHAWSGAGGVLEMVDRVAKKSQSNNSYTAWRDVTPLHNQLVEALLSAPIHLIATMRSKTEYVLEPDSRGKMSPRKVGLAPVQRDGMEYEFDVVAEMNAENEFVVTKTRCKKLSGAVIAKPDGAVGATLLAWLTDGAPAQELPATPPPPPPPATATPGKPEPERVVVKSDAELDGALNTALGIVHGINPNAKWADVDSIAWHDRKDGKGTYYLLTGLDDGNQAIRITAFDTTALDLLGFDRGAIKRKGLGVVYSPVEVPYLTSEKDGVKYNELDGNTVKAQKQYKEQAS